MAMTAAELVAYLRLDKSGYDRGMSDAEGRMRKTKGQFKDWAKGMGRAAVDVTVAGAAAASGLATAVFTTGLNYNTLQQQSRAALETILGGAENANRQMDKLDEFARSSPFAKDVFIRAQQQLLGFGTEAEDVIPILSAVEDAVAAVGGSNQDIAEIVDIFADIQGTGKITGETIRRLGTRGIDAATIIGEQMGKSGAAIRDEITAGTLDADDAMEALTVGMTDKFGGAAANVKETAVGAADRIKASFRDIGSALATPFVDPKGGGKAIEWANDFADVLRAVEGHVPEFVEALEAKLTPSFENLSIHLKDARDAIKDFDVSDAITAIDDLTKHAPAIAGLSGAFLTMTSQNIPGLRNFTGHLSPIPVAMAAAIAASPGMRDGLAQVWEAAKPLVGVLGDTASLLSETLSGALETTGTLLGVVADVITPVVQWFAELPEPIRNAATAAVIFSQVKDPVLGFLGGMADKVMDVISKFDGWGGVLSGAIESTDDFKAALSLVNEEIGGVSGATDSMIGLLGGGWTIAVMGAVAVLTMWINKQAETKQNVEDLAETLDEQTGAWTDLTDAAINSRIADDYSKDSLADLNLEYSDLFDLIENGSGGYDTLLQKIKDNIVATQDVDEGTAGYSDAMQQADTQAREFLDPVYQLTLELEEAEEITRAAAEAQREANARLDEGERAHRRMIEAIQVAVDETASMDDRVRGLIDALDELNGETKTQEERDRDLAATQRSLNEWFESNAEEIGAMDESLVDMSTGMPAHTELGDQFNDMLQGMQKDAHQAALDIYDQAEAQDWSSEKTQEAIAEAYEPYIDTLQDLADQGYLSQDQVDKLTDSIIGVPEITAFLVTHNDSVTQTQRDVINLTGQIEAIPKGEVFVTDEDTIAGIENELEDMGYNIEHLDDGEVRITAIGIPEAEAALQDWISKQRFIEVVPQISRSGAKAETKSGAGARAGAKVGNYHGGIDTFTGMADGGIPSNRVMTSAQMVKPRDIRYAGDRTDVDEAWIPLDGSKRSKSILDEAIRRMPGYLAELPGEGRAAGGVEGTVMPPSIANVSGPDTSDLTETWVAAMTAMEDATQGTFDTIANTTGASQADIEAQLGASGERMTSETAASQRDMADAVAQAGSSMTGDVEQSQALMAQRVAASGNTMSSDVADTQRAMERRVSQAGGEMVEDTTDSQRTMSDRVATYGQNMASSTSEKQRKMTDDTRTQLANRVQVTSDQNAAMSRDTSANMATMASTVLSRLQEMKSDTGSNMSQLRNDAISKLVSLRSGANTEFSGMKKEGVSATQDMRVGMVNQMGLAQTPFTGKVNDLVDVLRSFSTSLNKAYGDMGVNVGKPVRMASGGVLPGYTPGVDVHKFTSPTGGNLELSGGESIMVPEFTRAVGPAWVAAMNSAARTSGPSGVRNAMQRKSGKTQKFADGGIFDGEFTDEARDIGTEYKAKLPDNWVKPVGKKVIDDVVEGMAEHLAQFFGDGAWQVRPTTGRITSRYGTGRGKYPHAGMDIAKSAGTPTVSPAAGIVRDTGWNIGPGRTGIGALIEHAAKLFTYMGHNPIGGLKVKKGDTVKPGDRIGAQGSTGNATGPHLHLEAHEGRAWNDVNPHPYWESAGGGGSFGGGGGSDRWASLVKVALRKNKLPTTGAYVQAWLRQIQTESGGNPNARQGIVDINSIMGMPARGLLQVIPPTFMAYAHTGHGNIMNPLDNALAAMAYAKSRYGSRGMLRAIGRGRGYRAGALSALPGLAEVAENGPELVLFGGGERVYNNRETQNILSGGLSDFDAERIGKAMAKYMPAGGDFNLTAVARDTDELTRSAGKVYRRRLNKMMGVG